MQKKRPRLSPNLPSYPRDGGYKHQREFTKNSSPNAELVKKAMGCNPGLVAMGPPPACCDIDTLKDGMTSGFRIKGRLTNKQQKTLPNGSKLGSFDITEDHLPGDKNKHIRVVMWDRICDRFLPHLQEGQKYTIYEANVKVREGELQLVLRKNSKFTSVRETSTGSNSNSNNLNEATSGGSNAPGKIKMPASQAHNVNNKKNAATAATAKKPGAQSKSIASVKFRTLTEIEELLKDGTKINCCGIVLKVGDHRSFTSAAKKKCLVQEVSLTDASGCVVKVSIWGDPKPISFTIEGKIAMIQGGSVKVYQEAKTVSCFKNQLTIAKPAEIPLHPALTALSEWAGNQGGSLVLKSNELRTSIAHMPEETEGHNTVEIVATLTSLPLDFTKRVPWYLACQDCNRKMEPSTADDDAYQCMECNVISQSPAMRYNLNCLMTDSTGSRYMTAFDAAALTILDQTPCTLLNKFVTSCNTDAYKQKLKSFLFRTFLLRCKVQPSTNDDHPQSRVTIVSAKRLDIPKEIEFLIAKIKDLELQNI